MKARPGLIQVSQIAITGDLPPSFCITDRIRPNPKPCSFLTVSFDLQKKPQQGILSKDAVNSDKTI
jgi:hypothetical protein